jgi:hypothetical protein
MVHPALKRRSSKKNHPKAKITKTKTNQPKCSNIESITHPHYHHLHHSAWPPWHLQIRFTHGWGPKLIQSSHSSHFTPVSMNMSLTSWFFLFNYVSTFFCETTNDLLIIINSSTKSSKNNKNINKFLDHLTKTTRPKVRTLLNLPHPLPLNFLKIIPPRCLASCQLWTPFLSRLSFKGLPCRIHTLLLFPASPSPFSYLVSSYWSCQMCSGTLIKK